MSERHYDWISPEHGPLYADFDWADAEAARASAEVGRTILVQAADTYEDSMFMLSVAREQATVCGVVAWVPLDRPAEAESALDLYRSSGLVRGVRALTHGYEDPQWILGPEVAQSLALLPPRSLTLDYVATSPEHLRAITVLARAHPGLTIVLDHLGSPPIAAGEWQPWADLLADLASTPNVAVKLSGLGTCSDVDSWTAAQWQPYVDHALGAFGSSRIMMGSDWPVAVLAGPFEKVWTAQCEVLGNLSSAEREDVLFRTAERVYSLPPSGDARVL